MSDRLEPLLRKVCLALAIVLVLRVGYAVFRPDPLAGLRIPELPALARDATNAAPGKAAAPTNLLAGAARGTNTPGSNDLASATLSPGTNASASTNMVAAAGSTNAPGTHLVSSATNLPAGTNGVVARTNAGAAVPPGMPPGMFPGMPPGMMPGMMPPGMMMPGMGGGGPGKPPAPLSPLVQARLDRVLQSELLGPVPRPLPMALLGIAGTNAFLRAANGQSGLVGEGGEIGGLKLLRIGTNRILVEDAGTKKELTIFEGVGGVSLLPPPAKPTP